MRLQQPQISIITTVDQNTEMDLQRAKKALQDQIEKYEKLELQSRKLKQENRMLEKFMTIETRSPYEITKEFQLDTVSEIEVMPDYQFGDN
jgi:hypothetical protein